MGEGEEDIEMWHVYCDDCREFLKSLRKNSVDAVVTDPPYGVN